MKSLLIVMMILTVKYSHYWPPLGGKNCYSFVDGVCISRMASGHRWQDWVDRAVACPMEWPFGTTVELDGEVWVCMDRGGKIRFGRDGLTYVDFLTPYGAYGYGQPIEVKVTLPAQSQIELPSSEGGKLVTLPHVSSVQYLRTSKVYGTQCQDQVSPSLKVSWECSITELGVGYINEYRDCDTEHYSSVPLNRGDRDSQVRLYPVLNGLEPSFDEGSPHNPVDEDYR